MPPFPTLSPASRPVPRRRAAAVLTLAATVALLAGGSVSWADTALVGSDPADGATVTAPRSVVLTFAEPVTTATVVVAGPGGQASGQTSVSGATVTRSVPTLAPGPYTVFYRVAAADGHAVDGKLRFTVTASASPSASPPPGLVAVQETDGTAAGGSDRSALAPWLIGAGTLILLAVAATTARATRRTRGRRAD